MTLSSLEKEILMCHAKEIDRAHLIAHPELFDDKDPKYRSLLKRRLKHEPIAYLTGYQPFLGLNIFVNRDVLIPRPETEEMVEIAIELIKLCSPNPKSCIVVDIGTGSGVIAVSLARYLKYLRIIGVDSSPKAIKIAKMNAAFHKVKSRCRFFVGDMFAPLKRKADMIIANPPYIPSNDIKILMPDVKNWEPHSALDGGKDGLKYIKEIIKNSPKYLNKGGFLLLEFGAGQARAVKKEAKRFFIFVNIKKDLSGIDRFLIAA